MDSRVFSLQPYRGLPVAPWDDSEHPMVMRYQPGHKAEIHQKIVKDASERVRAEGLSGAAVSAVMRDAGLTHGGFYKHFASKDELLVERERAITVRGYSF